MALAVLVASESDYAPDKVEKRPGAFRTISEVSDDVGTPQHVLRFWESRFAQIRPLKRAGGRRYYRPDDVDLLKGIQHLLHGQGYTIKGAQRVLKEHGVRFVQAIGRGEAEAMIPPLQEREVDVDLAPTETTSDAGAHLLKVLSDLRSCREALAGLRSGMFGDP